MQVSQLPTAIAFSHGLGRLRLSSSRRASAVAYGGRLDADFAPVTTTASSSSRHPGLVDVHSPVPFTKPLLSSISKAALRPKKSEVHMSSAAAETPHAL